MKRYNSLYYFLIVLLIMGAFASMAQNRYGLTILGAVFIAFGLSFLFQLLYRVRNKNKNVGAIIELSALTLLSFLVLLRLFYITFPFSEWLLVITGAVLLLVYVQRMIQRSRYFQLKNRPLSLLLLAFYGSIILFIISIVTIPFIPRLATYAGITAFVLLMVFLATVFIKRQFAVDGENVSAFGVIAHFKDQSILLISLFFIFALYFGFTRTGIVPELYSDEYPREYFELVNKAETGKESAVNGKHKHEEFKEMYDQFVNRNIIRDAKSATKP